MISQSRTIPRLNLPVGTDPKLIGTLNRWADEVQIVINSHASAVSATNQQGQKNTTATTNLGNTPVIAPNPITGNMQQGSLSKLPVAPRPVTPVTQDNLSDGVTRFARTSVHSSFRPLTNPLTATDAGSNSTVSIAAHTMQVGATAVSNSSGSITGLSYSTKYFIYYDDASLAGGSVSYQATTTKETALENSGRFYVGSILTPAATAPNSAGYGDGGTGAQYGSTAALLFGTATPSGSSVTTNANHAIDGDFTTFAGIAASGVEAGGLGLTNSPANSQIWSSLQLQVLSSVAANGSGTVSITWSYNGGVSGGTIYSTSANRALTLDTVTLPNNINPALLTVTASVSHPTSGTNTMNLYDVRLIGVI